MRICIGGQPGSGTTTLGKALAAKYGLSFYSGGSFFRDSAAERGMALAEFGELAKQNPDIDHEVDRRQTQFAKDNDNIIIESRLSGWFVENADIKILLTASQKCRSERIAEREGITPEKSYELTVEREACEALRYREYYGIDILSTEPFDLVISTELFNQDEVLAISSAAVDCLLKK